MFIHYCDSCNVRVDEGETVAVGEKTFCRTCAEKQGIRAGAAANTVSTSTGSGLHAHRSGLQRAPRRNSPSTGQRQLVVQRSASPRPASSQIRSSPAGYGSSRGAQNDTSKIAVWSLTAAGVILAGLGLILMSRGKKPAADPDETDNGKRPTVAERPKEPEKRISPTPAPTPAPTIVQTMVPNPPKKTEPDPPKAEPPKVSKEVENELDDIREGSARRELTKIRDIEKDPKSNAFEIRRRYEKFANTYRSTKAGREGADYLNTLPVLTQRPADVAENTEPGLLAKIYEKNFGDTIGGVIIKDCKLISSKVVSNVELPERGPVEATFGRGDNFAVEFTGFVEVPEDGNFSFFTNSDDGSIVYIGEIMIAAADGLHGMVEAGDSIPLKKGKHRYRALYFQGGGGAGIILSWSGPNIGKQAIPASAFSHTRE